MSRLEIETRRLVIRSFVPDDLPAIHRILDQSFGDGTNIHTETALRERQSWLNWSILSQEWFDKLHQPPYGDRAITLKASAKVVGSVGYVPLLDAFEQIPELRCTASAGRYNTPELGLFWVIDPHHRRQGYATEAARAMMDHAFQHLSLKRILATTEHSNVASQGVMRKAGMKLTRNPLPEPHWLQVVGVFDNTSPTG